MCPQKDEVAAKSARRDRGGFTVIELTMVIVLLGIIAGFAVPRLNYGRYRADAAMRGVRSVLQGAQRNAIMRQTNMVVAFDVAANAMQIIEDADNDCTLDNGERLVQRPLEEGAKFALPATPYSGTPATPVSGSNLCTIGGLQAVQFLRDGAASSTLDVYVTSKDALPTDFRYVRVTQASGRTDAWRFNSSGWKATN